MDLHPYLSFGRFLYAEALDRTGRISDAFEQFRLAVILCPDLPWLRGAEAACFARHGRRKEAAAILVDLLQTRKTEYIDAYYMAMLYDGLGDRDQAFQELERAYHEKSASMFAIKVDPRVDNLRGDPRFSAIVDRLFQPVHPQAASA